MAKDMTLSFKQFEKLKKYCDKKKIKFLSTAFGFRAINFLTRFKMEYNKVPSGEINNLVYLLINFRNHFPEKQGYIKECLKWSVKLDQSLHQLFSQNFKSC